MKTLVPQHPRHGLAAGDRGMETEQNAQTEPKRLSAADLARFRHQTGHWSLTTFF
jgi:hypothetical protein